MRVLFAVQFGFLALALGTSCGSDPTLESAAPLDASTSPATACLDGGCATATPSGPSGSIQVADAAQTSRPGHRVTGVRIDPAAASLSSLDGSQPSQAFRAFAVFDDGMERLLSNALTLEETGIGALTKDKFVASGAVGGIARLHATVPMASGQLSATADVTVSLTKTLLSTGVPADIAQQFEQAKAAIDPARAAGVVYPLDGVVVPQNVFPMDVQWSRAATGDVFRLTWTKPHLKAVTYVPFDPNRHWLVDLDVWRALARTDMDEPAALTVERLEAATGDKLGEPARMLTFAKAALTGSVYYWETDTLRLQRIDDGSGKAVAFMPNPPVTNDPSACVGCHSVSHSGRYLAGRLGAADSLGAVFDLTTDLTTNPAVPLWPVAERNLNWWFASWSPDDTRLIVSAGEGPELRLYDPMLGVRVNATGTLPHGTQPSWSPDGKRIAYVANGNGWGDNLTVGDLAVLEVTGPDTFGSAKVVHKGTSLAGGMVDDFPSWSPDSARLAFAHGTGSGSEKNDSQLFVMLPDGTGVAALERAASGKLDDFQPSFAPFQGGGYYWLTFLSRRVYGNDALGNGARPVEKRQQIWVTALRTDAAPGSDPSAVPFWLPGQDTHTSNISAAWSPRACRAASEQCAVGAECCSGDCRPNQSGSLVCSPPPPERCRPLYETCVSAADCCNSNCVDGVCASQTL